MLLDSLKNSKNFKNTEFKILMINPGVLAAIRVVGVRGDPFGAMQRDLLPDDDLLRSKHVGVPLSIFIVF